MTNFINFSETNGLSHYEFSDTDKVSISSGPTFVSKINDDVVDEETSPVDLNPKIGKLDNNYHFKHVSD